MTILRTWFGPSREKGLFSAIGKWLGMKDIEVGDPAFDEAFIIRAGGGVVTACD